MKTTHMDQLFDRALTDAAFLELLLRDPRAAVASVGATLTDAEVETLRGMTADDLRAFAAEYKAETDPDKRRAAC